MPKTKTKKKNISFSQINMYLGCPLRWKLKYIDGIKEFKPNISLIFGSAMHDTLQFYIKVMYDESVRKADSYDLGELLLMRMKYHYEKTAEQTGITDFTDSLEMQEHYLDGLAIINYFKKKRSSYFPRKKVELLGIEMKVDVKLFDGHEVNLIGYLDIVLRDTVTKKIKIIDIKTSTRGWKDYAKKDLNKTMQLVMYKMYFLNQYKKYKIDVDDIDIEYFIVKRKLIENCEFPQRRIQTFSPASGNVTRNKVEKKLKEFVDNAYNKDGSRNENGIYLPKPNQVTCKWCEFCNRKDLCPKGYVITR